MSKTFLAVIVVGASLSGVGALSQTTAPRQTVKQTWHRAMVGSTSLAERLQTADAVLVARLVETPTSRAHDVRPHLRHLNPGIPFEVPAVYPVMEYVLEIEDVLRDNSDLASGKRVTIGKVGGSAPYGDRDIQVLNDSQPDVKRGARYLMFLDHSDMFGMLMISDEDVFLLDGAVVVADSRAPRGGFVEELDNQNVQVGLSNVREAADRVPKKGFAARYKGAVLTNLPRQSVPTSIDSPYQPPPTVRTN